MKQRHKLWIALCCLPWACAFGAWSDDTPVALYRGGEIDAGALRDRFQEVRRGADTFQAALEQTRDSLEQRLGEDLLLDMALSGGLLDDATMRIALTYHHELTAAGQLWNQRRDSEVLEPTEADIAARYEATRDERYQRPAQYSFYHIFFATHLLDTLEEKQARLREAEGVLARIVQGEDFLALAQEHGEGEGEKSALLGPMPVGEINPVLDAAILAATHGEVLGPLETDFGYHILKVDAIQPEGYVPFEEVRRSIRRTLEGERFEAWREAMHNAALEAAEVFAPELLSATREAGGDQVVLALPGKQYDRDALLRESACLGERHQDLLERDPRQYTLRRLLARRLHDEAVAQGLTESATFATAWQTARDRLLRAEQQERLRALERTEPTQQEIDAELAEDPERYLEQEKKHLAYLALRAELPEDAGRGTRYARVERRMLELEDLLTPVREDRVAFLEWMPTVLEQVRGATGVDLGPVRMPEIDDDFVRGQMSAVHASRPLSDVLMDLDAGRAVVVYCHEVPPREPLPANEARRLARNRVQQRLAVQARSGIVQQVLEQYEFRWVEGWEAALPPENEP